MKVKHNVIILAHSFVSSLTAINKELEHSGHEVTIVNSVNQQKSIDTLSQFSQPMIIINNHVDLKYYGSKQVRFGKGDRAKNKTKFKSWNK